MKFRHIAEAEIGHRHHMIRYAQDAADVGIDKIRCAASVFDDGKICRTLGSADLPAWWIVYSMAWGISDRTLGCKLVAVMFLFIVEMKLIVTCHLMLTIGRE